MNLHLDRSAFDAIITNISKRSNIRRDILEKDYYVTLLLEELANRLNQGYAYFKGGTALYKGLGSLRRFSEDIDLTISTIDCTNSKKKKRLMDSTKFNSLIFDKEISNKKGSIEVEYIYDSIYEIDENDKLQRFGKVKIESTNFGLSEPTSKTIIAPHLYELASEEEKKILEKTYDVKPFEIITLSIERIFMDKLFAAEHYFLTNKYFDLSKHLYDLSVLLKDDKIIKMLNSKELYSKMINIQIEEENSRFGGISKYSCIDDLSFIDNLDDIIIKKEYETMMNIYVFNSLDYIEYIDIMKDVRYIRKLIRKCEQN